MKFFIAFIFLLLQQISVAQFNDSIKHYAKFASTGVINKTNTGSSYVLSNALNFNTRKKNTALNTSAAWVYGSNNGQLSNNDLAMHADLSLFNPPNKLSYWALVNFDKAYSLKVNYRLQAGAGVSYNFIDSPNLRINISDGILYEKSDLIEGNDLHKKYDIPRNSFRLLYRWNIKNRVTVTGIHFYQPSLLSIQDYIIQSNSTLSVKLYNWLSFTTTLVFNKVSATGRENLLLTYGLSFERYF